MCDYNKILPAGIRFLFLAAVILLKTSPHSPAGEQAELHPRLTWPEINRECRPGTYWWWMGSAVDPQNITRELEHYRAAGLGGVHIIPIYGAKGYENRYIDYLSPQWMTMLEYAVREAERLDMFVDMTTGSGWCFGGPNLKPEYTCALVDFDTLTQHPSQCQVKRAAPGGVGLMINPYYGEAIRHYLERFTSAFSAYNGPKPRAMYHDSFEYNSNWSPDLLDEFAKRRGYHLEEHKQYLQGKDTSDQAARVMSDYRETISDLMTDNFISAWVQWCRSNGFRTRNQAHGSPANLLDLYAACDIPETEMFNRDRSVFISKFASSAAHVAGRNLVASETGTWLKEHFTETLADMKDLVDLLFLSGINHIFYHGTCYSPGDAAWPGWLFYASTEMNPRNSIWRDVPALNVYVARCQAVLQSGQPDNDILLYWPIYDLWHNPGSISKHASGGLADRLTVHDRSWFENQPIAAVSHRLWDRGYGFDFISDRQLFAAQAKERQIVVPGGRYRLLLMPPCRRIPPETLSNILSLAENGASVAFVNALPDDVPGLGNLENRRRQLHDSLQRLKFSPSANAKFRTAALGDGHVMVGPLEDILNATGIEREPMVDLPGLMLIRRRLPDGRYYFIANRGEKPFGGWIPLGVAAQSAAILDPITGRTGVATMQTGANGQPQVYLQLQPGESTILQTFTELAIQGDKWPYYQSVGEPIEIVGSWDVKFIEGGPELPPPVQTDKLESWTNWGVAAERFAGTACYTIVFDTPTTCTTSWLIDLGQVCHSARVRLNGQDLGAVFMKPFCVRTEQLNPQGNILEIEVTNISANRIRDLDRQGVAWKNFYDINFVDMGYQAFDASKWPLRDSGLLGPVHIYREKAVLKAE